MAMLVKTTTDLLTEWVPQSPLSKTIKVESSVDSWMCQSRVLVEHKLEKETHSSSTLITTTKSTHLSLTLRQASTPKPFSGKTSS